MKCDKECFANVNGSCRALKEVMKECPFQKTGIDYTEIEQAILAYAVRRMDAAKID